MGWQQLHPVQEHGADGVGKVQEPTQMLCTIIWTIQIKERLEGTSVQGHNSWTKE